MGGNKGGDSSFTTFPMAVTRSSTRGKLRDEWTGDDCRGNQAGGHQLRLTSARHAECWTGRSWVKEEAGVMMGHSVLWMGGQGGRAAPYGCVNIRNGRPHMVRGSMGDRSSWGRELREQEGKMGG